MKELTYKNFINSPNLRFSGTDFPKHMIQPLSSREQTASSL